MKKLFIGLIILAFSVAAFPQTAAQKVFDTEIVFREMAAEKGLKAAFVEYLAPDGVMFDPDPKNGRELWNSRPESDAFLTWEPRKIEVSANGALAYSIGNSIYRANGAEDPNAVHGHYFTVWSRQPNGEYRAVIDAGIANGASSPIDESDWPLYKTTDPGKHSRGFSAADSSLGFYESITKRGAKYSYKRYLAEDAVIFRDGFPAIVGKDAALDHIKEHNPRVKFAKRKSFLEAEDLAYVSQVYALTDKKGEEYERGNFVQVWRLREGAWKIAAEIFVPALKTEAEQK